MTITKKDAQEFDKQLEQLKINAKVMTEEEEYRNAGISKVDAEGKGEASDDRGELDLTRRIDDLNTKVKNLEAISSAHKKLNGELNTEIIFYKGKCSHYEKRAKELENDNKKLAMEVADRVNQLRKAGLI